MSKKYKVLIAVLMLGLIFSLAIACTSDEPGTVTKSSDGSVSKDASAGGKVDEATKKAEAEARQNLSIGDIYEQRGAAVSVTAIDNGGKNYEKKKLLKVTVSYVNNSEEAISFNSFDWSMQDVNGVRTDAEIFADGEQLSSGDLAPGGKVSGDIYFLAKDASKVVYTNNMFLDGEENLAMWNVK